MLPETRQINYVPSKTIEKFLASNAFVRGIRGCIGSGKSVGMCMEIMRRIREQWPCADGVIRSRWVVIRNTLPQLETTTIKTWLDWFPEHIFGSISKKPPFRQLIKYHDPSAGQIEAEILFLALDKPEDVKKVLSLECTGAWINEAREVPKEILDALTGRVGRYPPKKDMPSNYPKDSPWPNWSGIIMDTNPPTDDHWWFRLAEEEEPEGYEFFSQPDAMSKEAENVENLPDDYYRKLVAGKSQEWIDVYVHGKYGSIEEGQPVYGKNFIPAIHVAKQPIEVHDQMPIYAGLDFGLTPCAIFGTRDMFGRWFILRELITEDMHLENFTPLLMQEVARHYGTRPVHWFGDPSGGFRNPNDGKSGFTVILNASNKKIVVQPAPGGNIIEPRKECVMRCLTQMVQGQPRLIIDPKCKIIIRGFNGGYQYKRIQVSGEARYAVEPMKNKFSHPHDALQYLLAGGGEYQDMMTGNRSTGRTIRMRTASR